jgi:hypothetical protein
MVGPCPTVGHEEYVAQSGAFVVDGTGHPSHGYAYPSPIGHNIANMDMHIQGAPLDRPTPVYNAKQCTWALTRTVYL